jgi:uncharacterized membrane protein YhaH (DUF805 family)
VTRNPYSPPSTRIEDAPNQSAAPRVGIRFWTHFYLSPAGRTGRLFYWLLGFIPLSLLGVGFGILLRAPDAIRYFLIGSILVLWPQMVILVRRLHDVNLTGWWVTLFWVLPVALVLLHVPLPPGTGTIVPWLAAIILGIVPGTRGPNRYGKDPRGNISVASSQTS